MNETALQTRAHPVIPAITLLGLSALLVIVAVLVILSDSSAGEGWPLMVSLLSLGWLSIYFLTSFLATKTAYTLLNAYVLALSLFHLGLIVQVGFGFVEAPAYTIGPEANWFEAAGWHVLVALGSIGIGAATSYFLVRREIIKPSVRTQLKLASDKFIFQQGLGLLIASIVFLTMGLATYGNLLSYSRGDLFASNLDSRGLGVFMMVFPGALVLLVISAHSKATKLFSYSFAALAFIVLMLSGYRSVALFPALLGVILWVKSGRRIPIYVAASALAGLLIAIAAIGVLRQLGTYEELGQDQLQASLQESSVSNSISEMGSTAGVFAQAIRFVPLEDEFLFGRSYWIAVKGMLPNIGSKVDGAFGRGAVKANVIAESDVIRRLRPADWITYRLNRWKFDNGQGVGFSAIAEAYINFGTLGVVVFFVFIGHLVTRLDAKDFVLYPLTYLIVASAFWPLIKTVRNDFGNFTKPFAFVLLTLIIWNIGLSILGKRAPIKKQIRAILRHHIRMDFESAK